MAECSNNQKNESQSDDMAGLNFIEEDNTKTLTLVQKSNQIDSQALRQVLAKPSEIGLTDEQERLAKAKPPNQLKTYVSLLAEGIGNGFGKTQMKEQFAEMKVDAKAINGIFKPEGIFDKMKISYDQQRVQIVADHTTGHVYLASQAVNAQDAATHIANAEVGFRYYQIHKMEFEASGIMEKDFYESAKKSEFGQKMNNPNAWRMFFTMAVNAGFDWKVAHATMSTWGIEPPSIIPRAKANINVIAYQDAIKNMTYLDKKARNRIIDDYMDKVSDRDAEKSWLQLEQEMKGGTKFGKLLEKAAKESGMEMDELIARVVCLNAAICEKAGVGQEFSLTVLNDKPTARASLVKMALK